jgi:hypothetical protein
VGMEEEEEKEVVVEAGEGGSFEEKSEIIYLFCVEGYLKNNQQVVLIGNVGICANIPSLNVATRTHTHTHARTH